MLWSSVFWSIRFPILTLGIALCSYTVWTTKKHRLLNRLPMLFAVKIAICQGIMCLCGLIFAIFSIVINEDQKNPPPLQNCVVPITPPFDVLAQIQAFIFKSAELIAFSLTTLLTVIIYNSIRNQERSRYLRKLKIACYAVPIILMAIMSSLSINGLCCIRFSDKDDSSYVYFNNVCIKQEGQQAAFYALWTGPCLLLTVITLIYVILIWIKKKQMRNNDLSTRQNTDHELALIIYYIPILSFILYAFDQLLTSFPMIWPKGWESAVVHSAPIYMSFVNTFTVIKYKRHLKKKYSDSLLDSLLQ